MTAAPQPMSLPALPANPLVSVIVANYNYGDYIAEATESILAQSYPHFELILCDDGSSDHSREVMERLKLGDDRIKVLFKQNGGQASAWNLAFEHSRGAIICLMDADDWFRADKLETVVNTFRERPLAGLAYNRYQLTDRQGVPIREPETDDMPEGWLRERAFSQGGFQFICRTSDLSMRREAASRIFPVPETLKGYGDAYIAQALPLITEVAAIPEAIAFYRIHEDNHSGKGNVGQINVTSVYRWTEAYLLIHEHLQEFLHREFDAAFAEKIRIEDVWPLWWYLPVLYVMQGQPREGVHGIDRQTILRNLPRSRARYKWQLLLRLPAPASYVLFRLWWGRGQIISDVKETLTTRALASKQAVLSLRDRLRAS